MKRILTYNQFLSDSLLSESLDPFIRKRNEFNVGDPVRIGNKIGKVTSVRGNICMVLFGSDHRKCLASELKKVTAPKIKDTTPTRQKRPIERDLNLNENILIDKRMPHLNAFLNVLLNDNGTPRHDDIFEEAAQSYVKYKYKDKVNASEAEKKQWVATAKAEFIAKIKALKDDPDPRKDAKGKNVDTIRLVLDLVDTQLSKYPDEEYSQNQTENLRDLAIQYMQGEKGSRVTGFLGFAAR
jgi:hypothetical protein